MAIKAVAFDAFGTRVRLLGEAPGNGSLQSLTEVLRLVDER